MPIRRGRLLTAALVVAVVGLTACTNGSAPVNRRPHTGSATASEVNGIQTVNIDATETYRFYPSTITVHPGKVRVILHNTGTGAPHNFQLTNFPADFVPLTAAGGTSEATFTTPSPGKYQFVCTIHVEDGQVGTLIVLPN